MIKDVKQYTCDRCGAVENVFFMNSHYAPPVGWSVIAGKDLCSQCMKDFEEFINEGKN